MRTQAKMAIANPGREASGGASPAHTQTSGFQNHDNRGYCLSHPLCRKCVIAAVMGSFNSQPDSLDSLIK